MKRYLFFIEYDYSYAVLRPIQDEIRRRGGETAWLPVGPEVHTRYLRDDEKQFDDVRQAIEWDPYAVLVPGNQVPKFIPGIKVEVFHGLNSGKRRRRDGLEYHFIIRGLFDLYCTHGPNTTQRFQELAEQHRTFRVAETGWSKLDPAFDGSIKPATEDRPCILFTSTHTPRLSAAPLVRDTLVALANNGQWKWLVNLHPKMPGEIVDSFRAAQGPNLEFLETDDLIPHMLRADVMLSDTSSILSEFLLLDKPVVTFRTARPMDCLIDIDQAGEIEQAVETALGRPSELMANIRRYAEEVHPYRDGCSSARTLDAIDEFDAQGRKGLKRKPLNLHRHWKMRRLLNY
jgi:hypothetical protein